MSEIRERAKEWIDRWDMSMAKAKDLGLGLWPDDIRECYTIIIDLLAELERVEKDERDPLREEMKSIALALGRSKTDGESDCDWHDLAGDVKQLLVDVSELGQNSCGECTDGWKYNRVEGRHTCTCMTEMEPFQILQMALESIAVDKGKNGTPWVEALTALRAVSPLGYARLIAENSEIRP